MALFTPEELEELRRADEELEEDFRLTPEDLIFSRELDKQAAYDRKDNRGRRAADRQRAYREANREKIADRQRAYREANRDAYNQYMREYLRRRRNSAKVTSGAAG